MDGQDRYGWRDVVVTSADLVAWPVAIAAATLFHEFDLTDPAKVTLMLVAVVGQYIIGSMTGLYRRRFRQLGFEEAGAVAVTAGAVGMLLIVEEHVMVNAGRFGQVLVLATALAVTFMLGQRYLRRVRARIVAVGTIADRQPVLVLGVGDGGYRAVHAMQSVRSSPYRPVALVDDDPRKRNIRFGGIKVEGTSAHLARIAHRHGARSVVIAIPSASSGELQRLHEVIAGAGLETLVMPPVQRLVGAGSPREITRYRDEEVLKRKVVEIDMESVCGIIAGARVLITGGGGSIGSELVRQVSALGPSRLAILDHDDSLLHGVMASIPADQRAACLPVLADVRDIDRLNEVFEDERPELVFHAAALKHVPALERAPREGWKTNVLATANVIAACEAYDVARLVNISTDKAANPINVLGATKRIAERLTSGAALRTRRPYVSVRFGNVIGSRGSAIETFEAQIAAGGPVTVTHPDVTRYFMAVREAVRLTMQAAAIGHPGEVLVLDMGEPIRVLDVAQQLIDQSGRSVEIVYTGLRAGEKLHEELLGADEHAKRPIHPMIDHVPVPGLDLVDGIDACAEAGTPPTTAAGLQVMAQHLATPSRHNLSSSEHSARSGLIPKG